MVTIIAVIINHVVWIKYILRKDFNNPFLIVPQCLTDQPSIASVLNRIHSQSVAPLQRDLTSGKLLTLKVKLNPKNRTVFVELSSKSEGKYFKGFLIEARPVDAFGSW